MGLLTTVMNAASGDLAKNLTAGADKIIEDFKANPEDVMKHTEAMETLKDSTLQAVEQLNINAQTAHDAEIADARKLQEAALAQSAWIAKNFIYCLAAAVIVLVFIFDYCAFFVNYPTANRDMINQISGVLNTGALIMVLGFFFGSSASSKTKDETISQMAKS